jgi:FAD/FMN-containing dehydrogenase
MTLKSWGNYPNHSQISHVTNWRDDLSADFLAVVKNHQTTLPFGNGRSYGDSCMASSGHVLQTRNLNRFIEVDWTRGIIKAEAGVTLEEILNLSIAQGWFLPVTSGTKYVTLGGAVANDIHGKNHHIRGTFGCHVQSFSLLRSDQKSLICSPQENANLFNATIGGLGLTGIIEWVEIKLMPIVSSLIDSTAIRFNSIDEFFDLSNELDAKNEYSVAWIDCLNVGRGVFFVGNHAKNGELKVSQKTKITMPITPPFSLMNGLSVKLLNATYYNLHKKGRQQKTLNYDPFFYPLDRILKWNRAYGKAGFQQYQCVIPEQNSRAAIKEILNEISRAKAGSFLAVLKRCGKIKSPGLLSFPLPGISLALDFAQRDEFNKKLFSRLDKILRQAKGRLYPAKDAHMSAADFKNFYPAWEALEHLRDPALSSHFWNRVIL